MVSNDAGDTVTTVSTDVVDGPLPLTTTVTDVRAPDRPVLRAQPEPAGRHVGSDLAAMKAAIVAIEDRRFYQHNGVDWQGTIRAVIANSASGDVVQGASTITQQYVKNYFLYVSAKTETERLKATEQTSARKLKEAQIALQMERASVEGRDPHPLSEHRVVRQRGGRGRGGGAHVLQHHADKLTVPSRRCLAGWCATSPPPTRSRSRRPLWSGATWSSGRCASSR
jgi:hypothetical protein